jgi:peptide-methionine (S)-S-oxide reductase
MNNYLETAVFGGGCFWCTEAIFQRLKGVAAVSSGYAGGEKDNPTYEEVSSGSTGHAEVIKIEFDPKQIRFRDLLEVFFAMHDPTTLNRQGADEGTQYRSVILYANEEQKQEAEKFIAEVTNEKIFQSPVVTQLQKLGKFYEAEQYHKDYYNNNQSKGYCQVVINPKLEKFKKNFASLQKSE